MAVSISTAGRQLGTILILQFMFSLAIISENGVDDFHMQQDLQQDLQQEEVEISSSELINRLIV